MRTPLIALIIGVLLATTGFATAAVVGKSDLPSAKVAQTTPGGGGAGGEEGGGSASANEGNGNGSNLPSTGLGIGGLVLAGGILVGSGMFVRRSQPGEAS